MATSLEVNLTTTLQATLNHQGVFAYAVYFDHANGNTVWTTLVDGTTATPVVNASTTIDLTGASPLPTDFKSGKIYFLIESVTPGASSNLQTVIQTESDLTWANANTYGFRYDSFEFNLQNSSTDEGNLTSVNGFGIPMTVDVNGDTRAYNASATTLFQDVINFSAAGSQNWTYHVGPLAGDQRMVLSPAEAVANGLAGFQASDWSDYVTALESATSDVVIAGYFNGAPSGVPGSQVWHNAGYYSYQLSFDGTYFWLSPTPSSEIQGYIRISPSQLENSIYSTLGTADIFTTFPTSQGATPYLANMNTGDNNQWGEVFTQFLTGFMAGYLGGSGNPLNPTSLTNPLGSVDLDKSWNWDPTYAFGGSGTNALTAGITGNKYDPYAEWFFDHSNSYGGGYSDNLMSAFPAGGPLISLWDSSTGSDAGTITLTLYDDSETPTGYIQPVMYNYIPAPAGGYAAPAQFVGDGLNIGFSLSNATMMVEDDTPISFSFYNGGSSGTFTTLSLPTDQSIYQNWNIEFDGTNYSLETFGSNTSGNLLFNQVPVAVGGGISWYQITVGSGSSAKVFNLYATTDASNEFTNPSYPGQETAVQIDGLASVAANPATATVGTFTVDLFPGLPSSLLTQITDQTIITNAGNGSYPTPDAPVVGSLSSLNVFTELAAPGASNPTIATGTPAFGWNGADSTAGNDISAYTNKIGALNVARVSVTLSGVNLMSVAGTADIDGNWVTSAAQLGNGTYNVVMNEYAATDTKFTTPLAKESTSQEFTVQLTSLALGATADGDGLELAADSSGTPGNWIRLETTQTTLKNGTVLVYVTDAAGNPIGRDGSVGVTLDQAVVARIGSVTSDSGALLFRGEHSIYLPVGQQMHFAVLSGDGTIHETPGVTVSLSGGITLQTGAGTVELAAFVENTLSLDATVAYSQRSYDTPWVYLTEGMTITVEFAGSAANINTAHFVLIDVDPTTGDWSVGGVSYGNTDAFRDAVRSNWDAGISLKSGGGTFTGNIEWTVAGASGFYAPVLAAADGDIFVIGDANLDGQEHVRMFGENTFGFEDLKSWQGSDFDFNDMIVKLSWDAVL